MALSDVKIRNAKPKAKPYKLADAAGLFLAVSPAGGKWWRLKYRHGGKEKLLSLGTYPEVPLARAREKRDEARRMIADGKDPSQERQEAKRQAKIAAANSLETVAREWHSKQAPGWSPKYADMILRWFEKDVFPAIGARPVADLSVTDVLDCLRTVERRGALEIVRELRQKIEAVCAYAIRNDLAKKNPATELTGVFTARVRQSRAAMPAAELPEFLNRLESYDGSAITRCAMKLCILTMTRTIETIGACWREFDLGRAAWEIPGERMKMKRSHLVPLSPQALEVLDELRPISGQGTLVFPGEITRDKPISNNTMLYALYRLGYHKRATMHGFRAVASTILNETGHFRADVIEKQLAHEEQNKVRRAYNRAEYWEERVRMIQWWADHLDALRTGSKVVLLPAARA